MRIDKNKKLECGPCCTVTTTVKFDNGLELKQYADGKVSIFDTVRKFFIYAGTNNGDHQQDFDPIEHGEEKKFFLDCRFNNTRNRIMTKEQFSTYLEFIDKESRERLDEWYDELEASVWREEQIKEQNDRIIKHLPEWNYQEQRFAIVPA